MLVVAETVGVPGVVSLVVIEFDALEALDVPTALVDVTVNVYAVLGVKPLIEIVPEPAWESVPVIPPGEEVAVYEVIAEPPLLIGAVKETVAVVVPVEVAVPIVGAPGVVKGVALT